MFTKKQEMDFIRSAAIEDLKDIFSKSDVQQINSHEIAIPTVGAEGNEYWIVYSVKVPTGANKGTEPFDGYAEAEDYERKLKEKAIKAQKRAEKDKRQKEKREKEIALNQKTK